MEKNITVNASNMSELVRKSFQECLFTDGEDVTDAVKVKGITRNFGFHPERLEEQREIVKALLEELPEEFKQGYTFLNFCTTKNGELWTGEHQVCEWLIVMAIGLGMMEFCMPRELWCVLPGGVPYVIVK